MDPEFLNLTVSSQCTRAVYVVRKVYATESHIITLLLLFPHFYKQDTGVVIVQHFWLYFTASCFHSNPYFSFGK